MGITSCNTFWYNTEIRKLPNRAEWGCSDVKENEWARGWTACCGGGERVAGSIPRTRSTPPTRVRTPASCKEKGMCKGYQPHNKIQIHYLGTATCHSQQSSLITKEFSSQEHNVLDPVSLNQPLHLTTGVKKRKPTYCSTRLEVYRLSLCSCHSPSRSSVCCSWRRRRHRLKYKS